VAHEVTGGAHLARAREHESALGQCTVFTPHATAAITINENDDPNIGRDLTAAPDRTVPLRAGWLHDRIDGNAAAHIESAIVGPSETIPEGLTGMSSEPSPRACRATERSSSLAGGWGAPSPRANPSLDGRRTGECHAARLGRYARRRSEPSPPEVPRKPDTLRKRLGASFRRSRGGRSGAPTSS
jgi:Uncharacterised protein family UPF0047